MYGRKYSCEFLNVNINNYIIMINETSTVFLLVFIFDLFY